MFAVSVVLSTPAVMLLRSSTLEVIELITVSSVATTANQLPVCAEVSEIYFPPLSPNPLYSDAMIKYWFGMLFRMLRIV